MQQVKNGRLAEIKSASIHVGDIVRVDNGQGIPCDIVILSTSDPTGLAFVTTAGLDGETNLKVRLAVSVCLCLPATPILLLQPVISLTKSRIPNPDRVSMGITSCTLRFIYSSWIAGFSFRLHQTCNTSSSKLGKEFVNHAKSSRYIRSSHTEISHSIWGFQSCFCA